MVHIDHLLLQCSMKITAIWILTKLTCTHTTSGKYEKNTKSYAYSLAAIFSTTICLVLIATFPKYFLFCLSGKKIPGALFLIIRICRCRFKPVCYSLHQTVTNAGLLTKMTGALPEQLLQQPYNHTTKKKIKK